MVFSIRYMARCEKFSFDESRSGRDKKNGGQDNLLLKPPRSGRGARWSPSFVSRREKSTGIPVSGFVSAFLNAP